MQHTRLQAFLLRHCKGAPVEVSWYIGIMLLVSNGSQTYLAKTSNYVGYFCNYFAIIPFTLQKCSSTLVVCAKPLAYNLTAATTFFQLRRLTWPQDVAAEGRSFILP